MLLWFPTWFLVAGSKSCRHFWQWHSRTVALCSVNPKLKKGCGNLLCSWLGSETCDSDAVWDWYQSNIQLHVNLLYATKGSSNSRRPKYNRDRGNVHPCRFCGGQHLRGKCPAFRKSSAKGGLVYHFAKVCEQSPQQHGFPKRIYKQIKNSRHLKNCASLQTDSELKVQEFLISSISDSSFDDS